MFHGRISLNSVLLLLLVNFVSGFRLELMYVSLMVSIRSNLTHLLVFQLLVLLPYFIEITFFCLYHQNKFSQSKVKFRQASNHCKSLPNLKLPNLHMLLKQKSPSLPRNLAFRTLGELPRDDAHMTSMKIVQFPIPPTPLVHLRPKFFHPLDLGHPTSNEPPTPPTPHPSPKDNQSKENTVQG